ncbi:MAG: tetratricopeptide repeat protein [Proteobacteria bacterium]|nr:tetratricopeptide repeat protein [Pseudomonadota bacterium]
MFTTLTALFLAFPAIAGSDADVEAGVAAYEQHNFDRAIQELEKSLTTPGKLTSDHAVRARYYLGKALLDAYMLAGKENDREAAAKLVDAQERAADAYLQVRASSSKEWAPKAERELAVLKMHLLRGAMQIHTLPADMEGREVGLSLAHSWVNKAIEIDPQSSISYDLRGQIREGLGKKEAAFGDFREALKVCQANPPVIPDLLIAYAAYRAAVYARMEKGNATLAMSFIDDGLVLLDREWQRIEGATAEQQEQYQQAKADLTNLRLDTLLNNPDMRAQALAEFAAAVKAEPDDYVKHVAYAQLLEASDAEAAIAMYQKAIAIDDQQQMAHFNLGAVYMNRGVELMRQANLMDDYEAADVKQNEALGELKKARPHFEKALSLVPDDEYAIRALMQIVLQFGEEETYQALKARLP